MMLFAITFLATAVIIGPAAADWRYAKWGMTVEQLIRASGGEAKPLGAATNEVCAFNDQTPVAIAKNVKIDEFTFNVVFCIGGQVTLTSVALESTANNYNSVRAALLAKYGRPVSDERGDIVVTVWNDVKSGNLVRLIRVLDNARIEYRRISRGL